jgi:hypothetical protein
MHYYFGGQIKAYSRLDDALVSTFAHLILNTQKVKDNYDYLKTARFLSIEMIIFIVLILAAFFMKLGIKAFISSLVI